MKNDFQLLRLMVDELNSTNSTNDKRDILSKYDDEFIKLVIYYTYNPTFQYYVTPDNLEKNYSNDLGKVVKYNDLFELLDALKGCLILYNELNITKIQKYEEPKTTLRPYITMKNGVTVKEWMEIPIKR
jgi:hypothetical protein